MNDNYSLSIIYEVKTRSNNKSDKFQITEFKSSDALKSRQEAFRFIENYLEVITNEGLIQISSNLINQNAIQQTNFEISTPDEDNFEKLKLFNQETIAFIPNADLFPDGISVSFKLNQDFEGLKKDKKYEIFNLKAPQDINYTLQINNLISENKLLKKAGYKISKLEVSMSKELLPSFKIKPKNFLIIDTPFQWNNIIKQVFINKLYDENLSYSLIYEHLINSEKYDYVNFLEENCLVEIEKNIYALLHERGGFLFIGYHPENLVESVMCDDDIMDYYHLLNFIFSKDKYLYKNISLNIINYEDFAVLAVSVYPLNEESKKQQAYNGDKIFVRLNNKIVRLNEELED